MPRQFVLNPQEILSTALTEADFKGYCLEVFRYQVRENKVYGDWVRLLKVDPQAVSRIEQIPFLPISVFKTHKVLCGEKTEHTEIFTSSATTSQTPSQHFVNDIKIYRDSFMRGFGHFYGEPSDFCILALLPNYLSRKGSSLVYMCQALIEQSQHPLSGFFLDDIHELLRRIKLLNHTPQKVLLIGVSYALLDLCEHGLQLGENIIVMETGGMKGTRKELTKEELHTTLKEGLKTNSVHSEYGMTELLSQAYSRGGNAFEAPAWMRFYIREIEDPLQLKKDKRTGGINVIDLANLHSCSFVATQDLGKINEYGHLQLLGRYDNSDVRGCNLMYDTVN
jgi:phenylacetate-coenzyme A ligase PaaK-like adenylate-forming protein